MSPHSPKTAFLFLQLGTPKQSSLGSIFVFLHRFLTDWRVIDIPFVFRWILVTFLIIPLRLNKVAHAYRSIWMPQGSPLRVHSKCLTDELRKRHPDHVIECAMNYDHKDIAKALEKIMMSRPERIMVLPLFPQYAASSSGSVIAHVYQEAAKLWDPPALIVKKDFYKDAGFIEAYTDLMRPALESSIDLIVLSFHGLPVRHLTKSGCDMATTCQSKACHYDTFESCCYRAQCYETAEAIRLCLKTSIRIAVVFQSRLGSLPWIEPDIESQISSWKNEGVHNIMIAMPSFTADCLETLEEIGLRFQEQWSQEVPDGQVTVIPCLNAHSLWVTVLSQWIETIENLNINLPQADTLSVRHKKESTDCDVEGL